MEDVAARFNETFRSASPRWLFVIVYISGSLLIASAVVAVQVGVVIGILVSLIPMIIYIYYAYLRRDEEIIEQIADSLYFLGFLFTLTSISCSLFVLGEEEFSTGPATIGRIVSVFGFALVTTILGLSAKIVFVQFRSDLGSVERHVTDQLSETSIRFEQQLDDTIRRFQVMDQKMAEAFEKRFESTTEQLDVAITQTSTHLASFIDESKNHLAKAMEDSANAVKLPKDVFVEQLSAPLQEFARVIGEYSGNLADIAKEQREVQEDIRRTGTSAKGMANGLANVGKQISLFRESLERAHGVRGEIEDLTGSYHEISVVAKQTRDLLSDHEGGLAEVSMGLVRSLREVGERISFVRDEFKSIGDSVSALNENAEEIKSVLATNTAMLGAITGFADEISRFRDSIAKTPDLVSENLHQLTQLARALHETMTSQTSIVDRTKTMSAGLEENLDEITKFRRELLAAMNESKDTIRQFFSELVAAAKFVNDKLERQ